MQLDGINQQMGDILVPSAIYVKTFSKSPSLCEKAASGLADDVESVSP